MLNLVYRNNKTSRIIKVRMSMMENGLYLRKNLNFVHRIIFLKIHLNENVLYDLFLYDHQFFDGFSVYNQKKV